MSNWMQDLPRLAVGALSKGPGGKIHSMLRWTSWPECPEVPVDLHEVGRDNEWRDPRICFCFCHYYCCCSYHALIVDVVDNDQNDVNDIDDDGTRWGATTSGETHASVFICYYCYHFLMLLLMAMTKY